MTEVVKIGDQQFRKTDKGWLDDKTNVLANKGMQSMLELIENKTLSKTDQPDHPHLPQGPQKVPEAKEEPKPDEKVWDGEPITIGGEKYIYDEDRGWMNAKSKRRGDDNLIPLLEKISGKKNTPRIKIKKQEVEPVSIGGEKYIYDVKKQHWVTDKGKNKASDAIQDLLSQFVTASAISKMADDLPLAAAALSVEKPRKSKSKDDATKVKGKGFSKSTNNILVKMIKQLEAINDTIVSSAKSDYASSGLSSSQGREDVIEQFAKDAERVPGQSEETKDGESSSLLPAMLILGAIGTALYGVIEAISGIYDFFTGGPEVEDVETEEEKQKIHDASPWAWNQEQNKELAPVASDPAPMTTPAPAPKPGWSLTKEEAPAPKPKREASKPTPTAPIPKPKANAGWSIMKDTPTKAEPKPQAKKQSDKKTSKKSDVTKTASRDTGSGYTVPGVLDSQGRPVIFTKEAASAFKRMIKDSNGVVSGKDVTSSQRSVGKNKAVGGVENSKHLHGNAMDIHGRSEKWIRANGSKYGWRANDYKGSHGGHFEFGGKTSNKPDEGNAPLSKAAIGDAVEGVVGPSMMKALRDVLKNIASPDAEYTGSISDTTKNNNNNIGELARQRYADSVDKTSSDKPADKLIQELPNLNADSGGTVQTPSSTNDRSIVNDYLMYFGFDSMSSGVSTQ